MELCQKGMPFFAGSIYMNNSMIEDAISNYKTQTKTHYFFEDES
jgi:hypothetical protein